MSAAGAPVRSTTSSTSDRILGAGSERLARFSCRAWLETLNEPDCDDSSSWRMTLSGRNSSRWSRRIVRRRSTSFWVYLR